MAQRRWNLSPETITAVGAVFTAFVALAVGVWDNIETRRHNRLSVVPHLSLATTLNTADSDSTDIGIMFVRNEGVGPAVVQSVRIRILDDDGREKNFETWGDAREAVEALGVSVTGRAELGPGTVLGTGRRLDLLTFETRSTADNRIADGQNHPFDQILTQLSLRIDYKSVYGDAFVEETGAG